MYFSSLAFAEIISEQVDILDLIEEKSLLILIFDFAMILLGSRCDLATVVGPMWNHSRIHIEDHIRDHMIFCGAAWWPAEQIGRRLAEDWPKIG